MSVCLLAAVSVASFPCPCQLYACKYSLFLSKMSYVLIKTQVILLFCLSSVLHRRLGMLRTINSHLKLLYFHFLRNSRKKGKNIAMRLLNTLNAPGIATAIFVKKKRLSL